MKGDDISERLIDVAIRIIRLSKSLPKHYAEEHIARQVLRSGTSAGANYEEARGGESLADFIHKLGVTLKELRETLYWLKVLDRAEIIQKSRLCEITKEVDELCAILVASIATAKKSKEKKAQYPHSR